MGRVDVMRRDVRALTEEGLDQLAAMVQELSTLHPPIRHTVIAATTVAETFVDSSLALLIESSGIGKSPFGAALLQTVGDGFFQGWPDRLHWLNKGFGIEVGGTTAGQNLQTLIELRNALIHGGGTLTDRQSRDVPSLLELERRLRRLLHVQVEGGRISFVGPTDVVALQVVRTFMLEFDERLAALNLN
jgi:hypothetical protein